jgi:hypothetical protein
VRMTMGNDKGYNLNQEQSSRYNPQVKYRTRAQRYYHARGCDNFRTSYCTQRGDFSSSTTHYIETQKHTPFYASKLSTLCFIFDTCMIHFFSLPSYSCFSFHIPAQSHLTSRAYLTLHLRYLLVKHSPPASCPPLV